MALPHISSVQGIPPVQYKSGDLRSKYTVLDFISSFIFAALYPPGGDNILMGAKSTINFNIIINHHDKGGQVVFVPGLATCLVIKPFGK